MVKKSWVLKRKEKENKMERNKKETWYKLTWKPQWLGGKWRY